ncbi:MAG: hypothetical protein WDA60_07110 [Acidimicrobiia bacterium]|jgi:uncharacterized repeat protein (TIGR01451 family)
MKTRLWFAALVAVVLVLLGSGPALARGGPGGGGGGGGTATGADLQLTGSASTNSPDPGSVYSYSFLVKNSGPADATGVVFRDPIPNTVVPNYATVNGSVLPCVGIGDPSDVADPQPANNAKTVSVAVKAPTGGVCKGGVCDTVPAPVAAPCVTLTSVSAPVGYYSIWAAVWNDFTLQSCSTGSESVTVEVTETNVATGSVDYSVVMPTTLAASQNLSYVLDNDFAPFSTTYLVSYVVRDSSGTVLASASTTATTPAAR